MTKAPTRTAAPVWKSYDPTAGTVAGSYTLDREVTAARREMGEARWAQLQTEWSAKP